MTAVSNCGVIAAGHVIKQFNETQNQHQKNDSAEYQLGALFSELNRWFYSVDNFFTGNNDIHPQFTIIEII